MWPLVSAVHGVAFEHYFVVTQFSTLGYFVSFGFFLSGSHFKEED